MTHLLVLTKENEKEKKGERLQKKECRVGFGPTFVYLLSITSFLWELRGKGGGGGGGGVANHGG
jgi:hypothetical protein